MECLAGDSGEQQSDFLLLSSVDVTCAVRCFSGFVRPALEQNSNAIDMSLPDSGQNRCNSMSVEDLQSKWFKV